MLKFINTLCFLFLLFDCADCQKKFRDSGGSVFTELLSKEKDTTFRYDIWDTHHFLPKPIKINYPDSFNGKYDFGRIDFYSIINKKSKIIDIEIEFVSMVKDGYPVLGYEKHYNERIKESDEFKELKRQLLIIAKNIPFQQTKKVKKRKHYAFCMIDLSFKI
jgi:hypothetical protein